MNKLKLKKRLQYIAFLLPAGFPLVLFWIYPIVRTIHLSFTDWDYMTPEYNYVGFQNYGSMLSDEAFYEALKVTIWFGLGTVLPTLILGMLLALLIQQLGKGSTFYKALIFSPWITPTVAVAIVWTWIYEPDAGFANMLLQWLGFEGSAWIHSSQTALLSVIIMTVWKNAGYAMLFYIGALGRVPEELYEAAAIDGSGKIKRFFGITLPLVSPTTLLLMIMLTIQSLQAYDQIQVLTQGGPSGSTRTLLYRYYQLAFEQFNMGEASVNVAALLILTVLLSVLQLWVSKRHVHYQ